MWRLKIPNRFHIEIFVKDNAFWLLIKNVRSRSEKLIKLIEVSKINELMSEIGINTDISNYL